MRLEFTVHDCWIELALHCSDRVALSRGLRSALYPLVGALEAAFALSAFFSVYDIYDTIFST